MVVEGLYDIGSIHLLGEVYFVLREEGFVGFRGIMNGWTSIGVE